MRTRQLRTTIAVAAAALAAAAGGATAASQLGPAPGRALGEYFFGPKLARAEIVMGENGAVHDYRIDRGRIRAIGRGVIELKELDGTVERIPVAPDAEIVFQGGGPNRQLVRGMIVTTIRDGNAPADRVLASGGTRGKR